MHERIINPPKRKKKIMRDREREIDLVEERDRTILHQNSIALCQHCGLLLVSEEHRSYLVSIRR